MKIGELLAGKAKKSVQPAKTVLLQSVKIDQTESENKRKSQKLKSNRKVNNEKNNLANENFEKIAPKSPENTTGKAFEKKVWDHSLIIE